MNPNEELTFTYSGVVQRENRNAVCVRFERKRDGALQYAEGVVPEGRITKQEGFSQEEVEGLEAYLKTHTEEIKKNAKALNQIKNWFG
ncbi:MAG: hypothetical protein IJJ13_04600 [Lachnospiraceae bacterium]|nr:hypothetical protein [Lachnospiraceae bacterium]